MGHYERSHDKAKTIVDGEKVSFREKEKRYEEEIRVLKRRIDEAEFAAEKNKKEGEFNINIFRTTQESETKRISTDYQRVSQRLHET
jgi:hypothetical protein